MARVVGCHVISCDDDNVFSKGQHHRDQEVSRGEIGTEGAAESVRALPSTSPALWSSEDTELAAATPPLALEDQKAAAPSVLSEESTSPGTQSPFTVLFNTPASSQAQLYINLKVSSVTQALLEMQALRQQQEERAALEGWIAVAREAAIQAEGVGSPFCGWHSCPSPWPAQLGAQALRGQAGCPQDTSLPLQAGSAGAAGAVPVATARGVKVRAPRAGIAPRASLPAGLQLTCG